MANSTNVNRVDRADEADTLTSQPNRMAHGPWSVERIGEGLLRLLIDQTAEFAMVVTDAEGEIVAWNAGAALLFGYGESEAIGRHVSCLYPNCSAERERVDKCLHAALISGRITEKRSLIRKNGSELWTSIVLAPLNGDQGEQRGVVFIIHDITAQRRAEERLRLMADLSLNALVLINTRGEILSVNPQTERMFHYRREELIGESIELLTPDRLRREHPQYRNRFYVNAAVRLMGAGRALLGRKRDGTEFPIEIRFSPIETIDGPAVIGSILDITERKAAEERTRKHLAELAHVARLSTVGQMFSELAHEINQPLAAAANYARACVRCARTEQGVSTGNIIEWMEKTVVQSTRAIEIVKRLGAFVKKDGGTRSLVNVNALIERVVSLAVPSLQINANGSEPIRLDLMLDGQIPELAADAVQIEQVLLNLIRNAVEAMQSSPGRVNRLTLRTAADDDLVQVTVSDTGPGIPPDEIARLFTPYFTTKSDGMGLGLSISRSIVEDHGGRLDVESSPQGTAFRFVLPLGKPMVEA